MIVAVNMLYDTTLASMGTTARSAASASSNVWNETKNELRFKTWKLASGNALQCLKCDQFMIYVLTIQSRIQTLDLQILKTLITKPGVQSLDSKQGCCHGCFLWAKSKQTNNQKTNKDRPPVARTLPSQCWWHATSQALRAKLMCRKPERVKGAKKEEM